MSEGTQAAPKKTTAKPVEVDKKTITLTFEAKDLDLHAKIIKDAEDDDRTPSINLLRFVRANYGAKTPAPSA